MRNIIVTGGSRGLGLAIASVLARGGDRVIAVARTETEELRAVRLTVERESSGAIHFESFDLLNVGELGALVKRLRKQFGPLYALVNNAGLGTHGVLAMMRDDDIERLVRLNTVVPIVLTKHVLRSMLVEKAGRIVNIASIVASAGYNGLSAYAATKASLVGFTRSLAREVGPLGITVNAVAPGFIDTEMTSAMSETDRERIKRRSALKRLASAEDVAAAVQYLLSEHAKNVTGITLTVDAGSTA
jgi:3-oxoacyl-[acyl-carrier protein] reductase